MANDTHTALSNLGSDIYNNLLVSMNQYGRVATGKTIAAIEMVVEGNTRMYIIGPAYLVNLEVGRRPTGGSGPVDVQRYGGLSFKESLALWMAAKGIDQQLKSGSNQEYGPVFWAIYTSINKKGFAGTPGVLSKPLSDEAINKALDANLGPLADLFAGNVLRDIFGPQKGRQVGPQLK